MKINVFQVSFSLALLLVHQTYANFWFGCWTGLKDQRQKLEAAMFILSTRAFKASGATWARLEQGVELRSPT